MYFLAIKRRLAYSEDRKTSCAEPFGLKHMPARTLNDFFAAFFYCDQSAEGLVLLK
jgi:hypothetical protein